MTSGHGSASLRSESFRRIKPSRAGPYNACSRPGSRGAHPRAGSPLPRLGEHRGLVAGVPPPAGRSLARGAKRPARRPSRPAASGRSRLGARALLTMSVIFPLFRK